MKKHYTIPFFILHEGCPHKCIFCDQKNITGQKNITPKEIKSKIKEYLSTIPIENSNIEVGFFGGTFTALPREEQEKFLEPVQSFIAEGKLQGIRLSTRPDAITEERLELLKKKGVTCIELGVQSMSDKVLEAAGRGHTALDAIRSSKMITEKGFKLGHQMMLGLPSSTKEDEYYTSKKTRELGAKEVRIYPVLVIKDTHLAKLWKEGKYKPLEEAEAIERASNLILYFETNGIKVIRCGLHPSDGLIDGSEYLAGPFHQSFRQKVENKIFNMMLDEAIKERDIKEMLFSPHDKPYIFGFKDERTSLRKSIMKESDDVSQGSLLVKANDGDFFIDKKVLAERILPEDLK